MRGVIITFLSITIATDVIEKLISKHQIPTKNIRKLEIGLKGRIINYMILSTVVIADATIASDVIIIMMGIIGLIVRTGIIFIANLKSVKQLPPISLHISANNFEKEETIIELSSPAMHCHKVV